jgi:hypothetical protein
MIRLTVIVFCLPLIYDREAACYCSVTSTSISFFPLIFHVKSVLTFSETVLMSSFTVI